MSDSATNQPENMKKSENGHLYFYVVAIGFVILGFWMAFGGWDSFSSRFSKETQDLVVGALVGASVLLVAAGAYSILISHRVRRSLKEEAKRLKAAQEQE